MTRLRTRPSGASDLARVAQRALARCLLRPGRRRDAEPDDEVKMEPDQRDDRARDHEHMNRVEPRQGVRVDVGAPLQELRDERPEKRRGAVDVDADDRCPVGRLVPRKQVAREALCEPHCEEQHTDDPVQLPRILVSAEQEHPPHVHEHEDDEHRRAPAVHAAHEPAGEDVVRDVLDRAVSRVRIGLVVHREDHPGHRLHDERGQRRSPKRLPPVGVAWDFPEEEVLDAADEARPLLEPVERIQDRLLDLLSARGLDRCHQCGG